MKNILQWLRDYGIVLLVFVLLINAMQNCSQSNKLDRNSKSIKANAARIDSLQILLSTEVYVLPKEELSLMLEIQRLQTVKFVLYDWNTVVRTVVRPDDRMNEYDLQIAALTKELEKFRQNKRAKGK